MDDLGGGQYLAVSKRDGDLDEFIYSWSAPSPIGPWTPHKGVPAPNDFDAGLLKYAPLAHPQIPLGTGHMLVAVSRNTTDIRRLVEDPGLGVVEFVEVRCRNARQVIQGLWGGRGSNPRPKDYESSALTD